MITKHSHFPNAYFQVTFSLPLLRKLSVASAVLGKLLYFFMFLFKRTQQISVSKL